MPCVQPRLARADVALSFLPICVQANETCWLIIKMGSCWAIKNRLPRLFPPGHYYGGLNAQPLFYLFHLCPDGELASFRAFRRVLLRTSERERGEARYGPSRARNDLTLIQA